ncbi:hypothetical protein LBBP_03321 [Leptospira borgpetersenii serovar Ballum]|uniref:Uncharacterized protein n=1 Tax=Leptospira borgpetersenii serovar Ballum TaxID=280505 RepID=A0A0S2IV34_LEPBO|nr:hypothetical protein LBBP_03321 [Leptospira borgpetersenii serovar Ballum]
MLTKILFLIFMSIDLKILLYFTNRNYETNHQIFYQKPTFPL